MEWKWIKSFLIFVFIVLNCFLGYKVYQRNQAVTVNTESIESIQSILKARKISISNNENIEPKFIFLNEVASDKDIYIGRNRKILSFPIILTNFIRDMKFENITIKEIVLGYYPEMSQIDKTVLSGEAIPAWRIVLEDGTEYIYNAYLGEQMNKTY